jgi:hypothetical protein
MNLRRLLLICAALLLPGFILGDPSTNAGSGIPTPGVSAQVMTHKPPVPQGTTLDAEPEIP